MRNRRVRKAVPEIKDPQLEFARLAKSRNEQRVVGPKPGAVTPPSGIDCDFCFNEDPVK